MHDPAHPGEVLREYLPEEMSVTEAAVRIARDGVRELVSLRWGLIPHWAKEPKTGYRLINARAERVSSKSAFRDAFRRRRCLITADGFYEWKKVGTAKQPFHIRRKAGGDFAFAGLWEPWQGEGQEIESCSLIVTDASELLRPIHDRMPVMSGCPAVAPAPG